MTGYSGFLSWEKTGRGGVRVNIRVFQAPHKGRSQDLFLSRWQILVPLSYTHLS